MKRARVPFRILSTLIPVLAAVVLLSISWAPVNHAAVSPQGKGGAIKPVPPPTPPLRRKPPARANWANTSTGSSGAKENGAPLTETLVWLQEKMRYYLPGKVRHTEIVSIDGCRIVTRDYNANPNYNDDNDVEEEYVIDLGELDPARVIMRPGLYKHTRRCCFAIGLQTGRDLNPIKHRNGPKTNARMRNSAVWDQFTQQNFAYIFISNDREIAERISRAFVHAIKLCKKNEPF